MWEGGVFGHLRCGGSNLALGNCVKSWKAGRGQRRRRKAKWGERIQERVIKTAPVECVGSEEATSLLPEAFVLSTDENSNVETHSSSECLTMCH